MRQECEWGRCDALLPRLISLLIVAVPTNLAVPACIPLHLHAARAEKLNKTRAPNSAHQHNNKRTAKGETLHHNMSILSDPCIPIVFLPYAAWRQGAG